MRGYSVFLLVASLLMFSSARSGCAQTTEFDKVKVRFNRSEKDRRMVDKDARLIFDDASRKLIVEAKERPLEVGYDEIQKVIFERTTHARGGALGTIVGGLAGAAISGKHVTDYWCLLMINEPDGTGRPYLLEINEDAAAAVIEKMQSIMEESALEVEHDEKGEDVEKDVLAEVKSKHKMKADKKNHPLPELEPDKALVVVVCPALAARHAGKGDQIKLHANDKVVAVNKQGTYSFVHLDPGEYRFVSQVGNANGFSITLEAGNEYYFLQNMFKGTWKSTTTLTRHSKELVMYELSGAYYADWERKN